MSQPARRQGTRGRQPSAHRLGPQAPTPRPAHPGAAAGTQPAGGLLGRCRRSPGAASQAVTGSLPGTSLHRAILLSDGASRLVDPFGLATWEELLALLDESGPDELVRQVRPDELVRQVRAAEAVDPQGRQWPRTKGSDDATAVYLVVHHATGVQS